MQYLFDGAILLLLIIFTVMGVKKGIVKSIVEFVGAIFAAILSSWLANFVAVFVYDTFFRQGIYDKISDVSQKAVGQGTATAELFTQLPDFLQRLLELNGVTAAGIGESIQSAGDGVSLAITDAISPVFISFIKVFVIIIIFLLLMFAVKAIAKLVNGVFSIPVLKQINSIVGGVFGLLLGWLFIGIIWSAIEFFIPIMSESASTPLLYFSSNSNLLSFISNINPLAWIFT